MINIHTPFYQHILQLMVADPVFAVAAFFPKDNVSLKMQAYKHIHDFFNDW